MEHLNSLRRKFVTDHRRSNLVQREKIPDPIGWHVTRKPKDIIHQQFSSHERSITFQGTEKRIMAAYSLWSFSARNRETAVTFSPPTRKLILLINQHHSNMIAEQSDRMYLVVLTLGDGLLWLEGLVTVTRRIGQLGLWKLGYCDFGSRATVILTGGLLWLKELGYLDPHS